MDNNQFDILDLLTVIAFVIAVINLDENRTQTDGIKQIIDEVQEHLHKQDELLNKLSEHLIKQDELLERRYVYENQRIFREDN